jgi:(p)ppGpp synthase/HD superfamily hydrolase
MNIVDAARQIAISAHGGDRNKHDGEIYLLHLDRVYVNVRDAGGTEVQQAIAWLHDVLEDTSMTIQRLGEIFVELIHSHGLRLSIGDDIRVISAVDVLTKMKGESNIDYYHRVKMNPDARFVKLNGDIVDNFRRNHLIADEETRLRMAKKYSLGVDILS